MRYLGIFLLFLILVGFSFCEELTCQYKEKVKVGEETIMQAYSRETNDEIELVLKLNDGHAKPLTVINNNDVDVNAKIDIYVFCHSTSYSADRTFDVFVSARSSIDIPYPLTCGPNSTATFGILHRIVYVDTNSVYTEPKTVNKYEEQCVGLDDGSNCSLDSECGSKSCVRNVCSHEICFGNPPDCKCNLDAEFQYNDRMCLKKGSIDVGGKPVSDNPMECVTNYISNEVCKLKTSSSCQSSEDCASGFCVRAVCSANNLCYDLDCKCTNNEFEYQDKQCIKKKSISVGVKPTTNDAQECVTEYIDAKSGLCAIKIGNSCSINLDCGSGYCLGNKPKCSDTNICYNNNCECDVNQFEFLDKSGCSLRGITPNGEKPISDDARGCKSGYKDSKGYCAQSLGTILLLLIGIIVLLGIISVIVYFVIKHYDAKIKIILIEVEIKKLNVEKETVILSIRKLVAEKRAIESRLNKPNIKLEQKRKYLNEIKEVNAKLNKEEKEKVKILEKIKEKDREIQEITTKIITTMEINEKPHLDETYNKWLVIIDNKSGYEQFPKNGKFFHRWYYEREKGKIPYGYEIHHKDGNKRNNLLDNLELVTKEEHDKIHNRR